MAEKILVLAFFGLMFGLFYTRREKELDEKNNPCLRIYTARYGFLLVSILFFVGGLRDLDNSLYIKHPENYIVIFGFSIFAAIASFASFKYKLTLEEERIVIQRAFLRDIVISIKDISSLEEKNGSYTIKTTDAKKYKTSNALSGSKYFFEKLKTLTSV